MTTDALTASEQEADRLREVVDNMRALQQKIAHNAAIEITTLAERIRVLEEAARIAEPVIEEERNVILRSNVILYEKDPNVGKLDEEGQRLIAPLDNALAKLRAALHADRSGG